MVDFFKPAVVWFLLLNTSVILPVIKFAGMEKSCDFAERFKIINTLFFPALRVNAKMFASFPVSTFVYAAPEASAGFLRRKCNKVL